MLKWMQNTLNTLLVRIGIKPVLGFSLGWLRSKAEETETIWDEHGVDVLEAVVESEEITVRTIAEALSHKFNELAQDTETPVDDIFAETFSRVVESGTYTTKALLSALLSVCKEYTEKTENPFDDIAYEVVFKILQDTELI